MRSVGILLLIFESKDPFGRGNNIPTYKCEEHKLYLLSPNGEPTPEILGSPGEDEELFTWFDMVIGY